MMRIVRTHQLAVHTDPVKSYMPSYKLYLDGLRAGFFSILRGEEQQEQSKEKKQLQVLLNIKREIKTLNLL